MKIYLAGPFFNPDQVAAISRIEVLLSRFDDLEIYSPRKDGVLMNMTTEEKKASARRIFDLNCSHIVDSNVVLAIVDGRDQGVTWELGFAYSYKVNPHRNHDLRIITYTDEGFGLNVMIQECVDAHCRGMRDLEKVAEIISSRSWSSLDSFRNFDPQKVY